jgi:plastocyanin
MIISRISRETPTPRPLTVQLGEPRVSVVDNGYLPSQLTIAPGAHVTWANTGSEGHDVSGNGPGGMWQSGPLGPADRYQRPFVLAGNYDYWCSIHPEMRGRVVVQP